MMQKLSHPNVIQFKEIYTTRKQKLCIVMEYAENGDLDGKVAEQQAKGKHF
jgi:NIMA (never in mitosis gene a)-related kinase